MESLLNLAIKKIVSCIEYYDIESLIGLLPINVVNTILDTIDRTHQFAVSFNIDYEDDVYLQILK